MFPIWHQDNNNPNRATPADISALLELNEIPYIAEPSTTIPDHTCFKVGPADTKRAITLIEQETGRFNIENQEIEITAEERAAIDKVKADKELELAAKTNEREMITKAFAAKMAALINDESQDKKDDAEIATIDELIAKEEEE
jgi:hypothetical protein